METNEELYDHLIKIVITGDSGVGKSSLSLRYSENKFSDNSLNTIGVDFYMKNILYKNKKIKIQFWDTAGQEKYRAVSSAYYKNIYGAILVYDITDQLSFDNINKWCEELFEHKESYLVNILLIGNKIDLEKKRVIQTETAKNFAIKNNFYFMEVSAKSNINNLVNEAFDVLIERIIDNKEKNELINKNRDTFLEEKNKLYKEKNEKNEKNCC